MRRTRVAAIHALFALLAVSGIAQGHEPIDDTRLVTLAGNTRPEANVANDHGAVADGLPMRHMLLLLRPSPEREAALDQAIDDLQNPRSAGYRRWLSAGEFGARFGAGNTDLTAVTGWLAGQGFHVEAVYPNRTMIDFSGTAGQVRAAFHTEIHNLEVDGVPHIANMSDPEIPAALAPLVAGIVSLNDFRPRTQYTFASDCASRSVLKHVCYALVPADLATIYDLNPLHRALIVGTGEEIVVIEDSDIYSAADWTRFRKTFALDRFPGSFREIHPQRPGGAPDCTDPPHGGEDESEATLDAEWSSAAAPGAAIVLAACAGTNATSGLLIALLNVVNAAKTPDIISISYGECEAKNGAAQNAAYAAAYRQAAAEGISVFVSASDSGAAACDPHQPPALPAAHGLAVNGLASTAYNVAVGGTDFADTYTGSNALYWRSTNSATYGSARSYIPEIPWNSGCGSRLLAQYLTGSALTYGANGFCNGAAGKHYRHVDAGGGGASGCATGKPSVTDVVSGTCIGRAKPNWQAGILGNPADGVRDLPDVALYASGGVWGHRYVTCFSDPVKGKPCSGPPSTWSGSGGTSYAAPIMAGIQALVDQHAGGRQGNPAPVYYRLAAAEFGSLGNPACNASRGNKIDARCIFHDVTVGDTDEPCKAAYGCYQPSGHLGVLSTRNSVYRPAYVAGIGWDFTTGLGSVDAANLVENWPR